MHGYKNPVSCQSCGHYIESVLIQHCRFFSAIGVRSRARSTAEIQVMRAREGSVAIGARFTKQVPTSPVKTSIDRPSGRLQTPTSRVEVTLKRQGQ
jgi:hypothetical protein